MTKSNRIEKINDLIRDNLSKIIQKKLDKKSGVFVSVTKVETSPDLKSAKAFISIFPDNICFSTFSKLKKISFQKDLAKNLQIKFIPKISFILDNTQRKVSQIEKILQKIAQEKKDDNLNCQK